MRIYGKGRERQRDPLSNVIMCLDEEKRGKIFRWCDVLCSIAFGEIFLAALYVCTCAYKCAIRRLRRYMMAGIDVVQ